MRRTDPPVALVHEREDVGLILGLEARKDGVARIRLARGEELGLETFGVRLGACTEVHFLGYIASARSACAEREHTHCVGEEGVGARPAQEVSAYFLVRPVKVGIGHTHGLGTHHLLVTQGKRCSGRRDMHTYLEELPLHLSKATHFERGQ